MKLVVAFVIALGGVAHADPLKLDAHPETDAVLEACVRDGRVTPNGNDVTCKVLATRTLAGHRVRVVKMVEGGDETAYVELATTAGLIYVRDTTMHYTPGMGERSSPVHTERDWSHAPSIDPATLVDGTPATIVVIPWTSHDVEQPSGKSLGPTVAHAVIRVCALGDAAACSDRIDVDCPAKGCTATLDHGVLSLTIREQRQVTR